MDYFIYLTINLINNKKYIGKHQGSINDTYLGSGSILKDAIHKYGKENFKREILEIVNSEKELDMAEKKWIKFFNADNKNNLDFYNLHEGGTGGNTYKNLNLEQLEKIKQIKRKQTQGKNNPMYGKHHSETTKEKIRQTFKEKQISQGKNNPMFNKKGINNPNSLQIYAIIDGEKHFFTGVREAERILNIPSPNISRSLTSYGRFSAGKSKNGNRIYWFYVKEKE